eukprot:TRINITY_DN6124_c0_g1_i1.p1 TRINITY_DN6124_c0_g1~~TRINITY_DN6124_c0_g1_i1.p1  ORF type:complete len:278 (-),score=34.68 TRINITY_DN6124_c0_g1_i1:229-1062(-)
MQRTQDYLFRGWQHWLGPDAARKQWYQRRVRARPGRRLWPRRPALLVVDAWSYDLCTISVDDCSVAVVGPTGRDQWDGDPTGLTWSQNHKKMYASFSNCASAYLYEISLTTGESTYVGYISRCAPDIESSTSSTTLFTFDTWESVSQRLDPTNAATLEIGSLGFVAYPTGAGSLDYNECQRKMYLVAWNMFSGEELRILDIRTGNTTLVAALPYQVVGLSFRESQEEEFFLLVLICAVAAILLAVIVSISIACWKKHKARSYQGYNLIIQESSSSSL